LIGLFAEFLEKRPDALGRFFKMGIKAVDRALVESCLDKIPVEIDREYICEFISNGQKRLIELIGKLV